MIDSAPPRRSLRPLGRIGRIGIIGFAIGMTTATLLWAGLASGESLPGPPLEASAFQSGAYCLPRSESAGLGGAGFVGAVAAIAFIARRHRDPA